MKMIPAQPILKNAAQICTPTNGDIHSEQMNQVFLSKLATAPSASIPMATPLVSAQGQYLFGNQVASVPNVNGIPAISMKSPGEMSFSENGNEDSKFQQHMSAKRAEEGQNGKNSSRLEGAIPQPIIIKQVRHQSTDPDEKENQLARGKSRKGKACNFSPEQVNILKNWFMQNIDDPYPGPKVKEVLCAQTGLSWKQVSDWFQNARCRAWSKPPPNAQAKPASLTPNLLQAKTNDVNTSVRIKPEIKPQVQNPVVRQSYRPMTTIPVPVPVPPPVQPVLPGQLRVNPKPMTHVSIQTTKMHTQLPITNPEIQDRKPMVFATTPKPQQLNSTQSVSSVATTTTEPRIVRRRARLPRKARETLKKWFNEHLRYPYPTSNEKEMLQRQTGLTHRQIFNWFTNRRKRDPNWCPNKNNRSHGGKGHGKRKLMSNSSAVNLSGKFIQRENKRKKPDLGSEAELLLALAG
mmetsp:Transcript_12672/g.18977  ORF Transcript_12672/g.18977 Transcript_12672/m.18977 type:complete len:463 (+) Transcript_12672:117-1505(+)|eukprot:CAMPEP_0167755168 /NCGR_PEP_ID=MMETSP0110_2-20121227/8672_1 /TAXON_ID=629695 /ORGANISM="Gymnochlora sp., Strain CCMP2014" /LENGTH=462 /DNA_ID=CAMNT_0007641121 /DNA_START=38 /DNA_END=1426 /DNA_ORIENTATION=+